MSDNFNEYNWDKPTKSSPAGPWCVDHEHEIKSISEKTKELWDNFQTDRDKIEKHHEDIINLKNTVYGIDDQNGLRGKCKEIMQYLEIIKPEHVKLVDKLNEFNAFKKSVAKIIWLLIASLAITAFTNWNKIQSDETKIQTLQNIQTELSKLLEDKIKHPIP